MAKPRFRNLPLLCLLFLFSLVNSTFAVCQYTAYIGESQHEITVSDSQDEEILAVQEKFDAEIEQLRDTVHSAPNILRQRIFERDTALEKILNDSQLKLLNQKRKTETLKNAALAAKEAKSRAEFMEQFCKYLASLSKADELLIFEGLPRATEEELAKIKKANETIEIDGWSFYKQPLSPKPSIVEKLRATLSNYREFLPYSGGKFCGGFHPDFCVQWQCDGKTCYAQICFSCAEMLVITPDGKSAFDFNNASWKSFIQIAISSFANHKDTMVRIDKALGQ